MLLLGWKRIVLKHRNMRCGCLIGICPRLLRRLPMRPFWSLLCSPAERKGRCFFFVPCSFFLACQQLPSMFHVDHCETEGKAVQASLWCHQRELAVGLFLIRPERLFQKNQERQKRGGKLRLRVVPYKGKRCSDVLRFVLIFSKTSSVNEMLKFNCFNERWVLF